MDFDDPVHYGFSAEMVIPQYHQCLGEVIAGQIRVRRVYSAKAYR